MSSFKRALTFLALALTLVPLIPPTYAVTVFSDVASNHPNYKAIMYLRENGIVEGYADNTFQPEKSVNRAEALKIILLGSGILVPDIQNQDIFPDVLHGSWYAKFVTKAKNLNVVSGDGVTGLFRPGDTINLAEILKILLRANGIQPGPADKNPYADVPQDAWFAPYFSYAESISLLDTSSEENALPGMLVNRGLMAELMYRLSQKPEGYQEGTASYYGEQFHGKNTASGDVFDASLFTAAHRTFPFGTWVKVTNLNNGKEVTVRINDRGPYGDANRIIDLSKAAFESIGALSSGVLPVSVVPASSSKPKLPSVPDESLPKLPETPVEEATTPAANCPAKPTVTLLDRASFDNITLDAEIPNAYLANQTVGLTGVTKQDSSEMSAFLVDDKGDQIAFYAPVTDKRFSISLTFPSAGSFKLGILPTASGNSIIKPLTVIPEGCVSEVTSATLSAPNGLALSLKEGDTFVRWNKGDYNTFKITFTQGTLKKTFILGNTELFQPNYRDFSTFKEGEISLSLQGAKITEISPLEKGNITWSKASTLNFKATLHHDYSIEENALDLLDTPNALIANKAIKLMFDPKGNVRSEGAIILPSGLVKEVTLKSPSHSPFTNERDISILPASAKEISLEYTPKENALHFLEINDSEGLAVINIPLYPEGLYPLLPSPMDLSDREAQDLGNDLTALRNKMLTLVNTDRKTHGFSALVLDSKLTQLAQNRADDMTKNDYFSHWDSQGRSVNDLRKNYAISQQVSENLAKEVNLELAQYGLMRSALHRNNILSSDWSRAGFGISKHKDGSYLVVQIFSDDPLDLNNLSGLRTDILAAMNAKRSGPITLANNLNDLAQAWSTKMVSESFFDFTSPNGESLVDVIRNSGVNVTLGTYIIGNTSWDDAITQITENTQILENRWKNLGIGITQDDSSVIKVTLIYTE